MSNRWQCKNCRHRMVETEMLIALSPFNPDTILSACPKCKQCDEGFFQLCDEPGCDREATCGWPHPDGYRRTCGEHMGVMP